MTELLSASWQTYSTLVYTVLVHAMLGLSIYLTLACGQLSLGNASFMGIGAYTAALLTMRLDAPFGLSLLLGGLLPAFVALAIGVPVLRLSGVYLAMATLGFGEVVRVVFLNLSITGGPLGLNGVPLRTELWHLLLVLTVLVLFFAALRDSRFGRAMEAINEDETAARVMGIPTTAVKVGAFTAGAFIAGVAGGLNAHYTFFVSPREYGFEPAVDILAFAVLGGTRTYWGPIAGAAVLSLLPEVFRFLGPYRLALNGLILLLVIIYLPKGIVDRSSWERLAGMLGRSHARP
jgi:branched-chain amino acid transport system permease protein